MGAHWDLAKTVLVEKSPPNLIRTRFLQASSPARRSPSSFVTRSRSPWRQLGGAEPGGSLRSSSTGCAATSSSRTTSPVERVQVVRYEELVDDAETCVQRIWALVGLEPAPVETLVEPGSNKSYFEQWRALKGRPAVRAYLATTEARYERRVKRFGYSLRDPGGRRIPGAHEEFAGSGAGERLVASVSVPALRST